jgi:general nucleoside transport system ATP-binding protein
MVFQHFALFETLTVAENIALALDEPMLPQLAARIEEVSERYGLPIDPQHATARHVGRRTAAGRDRALPAAAPEAS